jgi:hypothetical protein
MSLGKFNLDRARYSCTHLPAFRSIRLAGLRLTHMHGQQFNRLSVPLIQQPPAILSAPGEYLVGVYSVRQRATPATDAPGFKVCSTIRHFSPTGHRRRCRSLLTTARSKVSIYSPSGHSRKCPLRAIFHTHPHFVQMYRPNAYPADLPSTVAGGPIRSPNYTRRYVVDGIIVCLITTHLNARVAMVSDLRGNQGCIETDI